MATVAAAAVGGKAVSFLMRLLLATIAAAAISALSWYVGYSTGKKSILEAQIASKEQTAVTVAEQTAITTETLVKYVDRVQYVKGKTETIVKEVKVHVKDACVLSPDWRLLHDEAAARGAVPRPAGETDGGAGIAAVVAGHRAD